jgi:hypothetical protein
MKSPEMFDIVKVSDLRKCSQERFGVLVVAKADGFGPVVAPLDHGARFEVITSKLVKVASPVTHFVSQCNLRPIAEKFT